MAPKRISLMASLKAKKKRFSRYLSAKQLASPKAKNLRWLRYIFKKKRASALAPPPEVLTSKKAVLSTWFTGSDRNDVVSLLFHENIEKQKKGLRRLEALKARSHPTVPLGIEVTSSLLTAKIASDEAEAKTVDDRAEMEKSCNLQLSMALVRFVNLILQSRRGNGAYSLIHIASTMGIPEWLVHVRHSVTHSHMQSTDVLKKTVKHALKWLKEFYWEDDGPEDFSNGCERKTDSEKDKIVQSLQNPQKVDKTISSVLKTLRPDDIIDILTSDGVLPISIEHLQDFLSKGTDVEKVMTEVIQIWRPFFNSLQKPDVSHHVLLFLIDATANSDLVLQQKMGLMWIEMLLKSFCPTRLQRETLRNTLLRLPLNTASISIIETLKSKMKPNGKKEIRYVDISKWEFQSSKWWKTFPIGMDKDDCKWFPNKLELEIPKMTSKDEMENMNDITMETNQVIVGTIDSVEKSRRKKKIKNVNKKKACLVLQQNIHLL